MIHFDLDDRYQDELIVGSALSKREGVLMSVVGQLIKGARDMRLSRFRNCRFCGTSNPPEWQQHDDVCQACADTEQGAVH